MTEAFGEKKNAAGLNPAASDIQLFDDHQTA